MLSFLRELGENEELTLTQKLIMLLALVLYNCIKNNLVQNMEVIGYLLFQVRVGKTLFELEQ